MPVRRKGGVAFDGFAVTECRAGGPRPNCCPTYGRANRYGHRTVALNRLLDAAERPSYASQTVGKASEVGKCHGMWPLRPCPGRGVAKTSILEILLEFSMFEKSEIETELHAGLKAAGLNPLDPTVQAINGVVSAYYAEKTAKVLAQVQDVLNRLTPQ